MDPITRQAIAVAGAGSSDPLYVDDVFSTYVYKGTNSTQSINNGIDLSGEGGLVWIKNRDANNDHNLYDTERGAAKRLRSNTTNSEQDTETYALQSFNSNGFTLGANWSGENTLNNRIVSWSFRKATQFFDVLTYNGTGSAQNISHSLGSVPGMIMIHCRDGTHDWEVYHRSTGPTKSLHLNNDSAATTDSTVWNNTTPTSSVFTVGTSNNVNQNGHEYVAYIFAHDEQAFGTDEDEAIIKCGTYTGNGQTAGTAVTLGFEPQWVMIRASDGSGGAWQMQNTMTGMAYEQGNNETVGNALYANFNHSESGFGPNVIPTVTGFEARNSSSYTNGNGVTYIYLAIRRSHKPPTAGTDVFKAVQTTSQPISVGFPTDLHISAETNSGGARYWVPRLTNNYLNSNSTSQESAGYTYFKFDLQNSFSTSGFFGSAQTINWQFRRAPGFFDVVAYRGTGSATTITHNLNATPSVVLIKGRDTTFSWYWQHYALGANTWVQLNNVETKAANGSLFNSTLPTSSVFSVGSLAGNNGSGNDYIAYLFGDLDGISKAGTYSGTGSNIDVDCGFAAGARFVLIKRTDSTGDWYVWDSTRGIVSGNDPYLLLNTSGAQVTNTDYIDPLNAGFTVTSSAPAEINASGGTYLFLAIA